MSPRTCLVASAVVAAALAVAPAAHADPVLANNACQGSDGQWGTLPLELAASSAVQNGRILEVGTIQPNVTIPSWLPDKVASFGAAIALATGGTGNKSVAVDAWMALAGDGSTDAPQVVKTTGALKFSLNGFLSYSVTNMSLTLAPAPATNWHAPDAGGPITIAQAPAGSLPEIPGGQGGSTVQPKGSLWIRGTISGVPLTIDCQPGATDNPQELSTSFTPAAAPALTGAVFAPGTSVVAPAPTPTPTPTPTPKTAPGTPAVLAVASPKLKFGRAAVLVKVACPAGAPCTGSIVMKSAKKLKVGKSHKKKVRTLARGTYKVAAGTTGTVKLTLTADGKKLRKKSLVTAITLKPRAGKAVRKRVRAN